MVRNAALANTTHRRWTLGYSSLAVAMWPSAKCPLESCAIHEAGLKLTSEIVRLASTAFMSRKTAESRPLASRTHASIDPLFANRQTPESSERLTQGLPTSLLPRDAMECTARARAGSPAVQ